MNGISAHRFLQAWKEAASLRETDLLENWSANLGKYTSIVKDDQDCIVKSVANKISLSHYSEYYHTDVIFYDNDDLVPNRKLGQTWVRGIKVAFEHEHIYDKSLYEEISHLLILQAGLSVVTTYPGTKDFTKVEHLDYFHDLIKGSPRAKELDEKENFLLIFGFRDPLEWKGLVFKCDKWQECGL